MPRWYHPPVSGAWQISIGTSTYEQLSEELRQYFARRLKGVVDPEDMVAEVWLDGGRRYQGRSSLRYYLFTIARTKVADLWRRLGRRPQLTFPDSDWSIGDLPAVVSGVETMAEREQLTAVVRECLSEVEFPFHEVVSLWLLEDMDAVQIAAKTGVPYNTVRSRLARGKRQLEAAVRDNLRPD